MSELSDHVKECFICRLPDCDTSNSRCGIRRGIKYELYPKSVLYSPSSGISKSLSSSDTVGFKEVDVWA